MICRLEVAMNHVNGMYILYPTRDLRHDIPNLQSDRRYKTAF